MGIIISKIKLINFKRFRDYTIETNEGMNILVGDNEVGKVVFWKLSILLLVGM